MQLTTTRQTKFFGLTFETGTRLPGPLQPLPPAGEKTQVRLGTLLGWLMTGVVEAYPHNRGIGSPDRPHGGKINMTTVNSVRHNLIPGCFGEIGFGPYADEKHYGNGLAHECLAMGHSRNLGALLCLLDGNMTEKMLNAPISVYRATTVEEFLNIYQLNGLSGIVHTIRMKTTTPSLAYGPYIQEIHGILPDFDVSKYSMAFQVMLYDLHLQNTEKADDEPKSWAKLYGLRPKASKMAEELCGAITVTPVQLQKVVTSVKYWKSIADLVIRYADQNGLPGDVSKACRKAITPVGMFGYIVSRHFYGETRSWSDDPRLMADRIIENSVTLASCGPKLCRTDQTELREVSYDVEKVLRKGVATKHTKNLLRESKRSVG